MVMFTSHVPHFSKDFSAKTLKALAAKKVFICGTHAIPDHSGDVYFSGTAYVLSGNGREFIRSHSQVLVMSASSWMPDGTDNEL